MTRRLAVPLAAALAVLGPAACGGDSGEEYRDGFRPLSRDLVALGEEVGQAIDGAGESSDSELAREFDGFARKLGGIRQRLDELEAPSELGEEQDELVAAAGEVQGALEDIAAAAERSDPEAARTATQELVRHSAVLRDARAELERAVGDL